MPTWWRSVDMVAPLCPVGMTRVAGDLCEGTRAGRLVAIQGRRVCVATAGFRVGKGGVRRMSKGSQLFARKSLDVLLKEMEGDQRLRRVLGPVTLTALGVGAVIGAGIFVATGAAAKSTAGPALMVSYMVAGITCIFAAL